MKKIHATKPQPPVVPPHRSFRRFVRQMFASLLNRQACDYEDGFQNTVMQKLQDIEDMIEIVAREMARRAKRGE